MRAVVTRAARPGSVEMIEIERPAVPEGGLLIAMREVGVDSTDHEVIRGEHGDKAPSGDDYLVLGHESLGRVIESRAEQPGLAEGTWVVCTVRRPDGCPNCRRGEIDMCLWGEYTERGIKGAHGFLAEYVIEDPRFVIPVPDAMRSVGALIEPLSITEKAVSRAWSIQERLYWDPQTALVFGQGTIGILAALVLRLRGVETYLYSREPAESNGAKLLNDAGITYISADDVAEIAALESHLGPIDVMIEATGAAEITAAAIPLVPANGVLVLLSITGASEPLAVDMAAINQRLVLGNGVVCGSVNSSRSHFEQAIHDLETMETRWPGLTGRLITRRVPFEQFADAFENRVDDIKVVIDLSEG